MPFHFRLPSKYRQTRKGKSMLQCIKELYPPGKQTESHKSVPFVKMAGKHGCAPIHLKGTNVLYKRENSVLQVLEQLHWRRFFFEQRSKYRGP